MPAPGKFVISKVANDTSQLHLYFKFRAGVKRNLPQQIMSYDDMIISYEEGDDRIRPQLMLNNDDFPFEDQKGVERIPPNGIMLYREVSLF